MAEGDVRIMTAYVQVDAKTEDATKKIDEVKTKVEGIKTPDLDPLDIETKEFNTKVEEAEKKSNSFSTAAGQLFGDIASKLAAVGVTALINGFISSVANLMDMAKNLGKEVKDGADALGLSTKEYQVWDRILKRSGGSAEDLSKGIENINKLLELGGADAPKEFQSTADAFEKLGISAKDANGNLRNTEDVLNETLKVLAGMQEGAEKTDLINALFGDKDGLNKTLEQSTAEIIALRNEAKKSVLSDDAIESSVRYNEALENLNASLTDLKTTASIGLLEPLTGLVDSMTAVMNFFNPDNWKDKSAEGQFKAIDKEAEETAQGITETAAQAETFIDKLLELNRVTDRTAEQEQQWQFYADWLIKNIPSLSEVIDKETGSIKAEAGELKENVAQWKERQKALIAQRAMQDKREVVAGFLQTASDAETKAVTAEAEAAGKRAVLIEKLNELISQSNDQETINAFLKGQQVSELSNVDLSSLIMLLGHDGQDITGLYEKINEIVEAEQKAAKARADAEAAYKTYEEESAKLETYAEAVQTVVNKAGEDATSAAEDVAAFGAEVDALPERKTVTIVERIVREDEFYSGGDDDGSHAAGLPSVPYDGYRAILHRGETVLTASQSRREKDGSGGVSVQDLTQALVAAMRGVKFAMDSEVVGGFVAPTVGEQLAASL